MAVQLPTPQQIRELADEIGLDLTDADVESYRGLLQGNVDAYNVVDAMPDHLPLVKYPRTPGYHPGGEENQYNAWYVKTEVKGAARGKLQGKTVVLKDTVMLAGVPMMNGTSLLEGYVPDIDATVVTRLLDAGATIVGKAHPTDFSMSGGSHSNAKGPIHNPHKMGYSAGGSSAGCGVLVAAGEVDLAIGGDQGGSIRIPAACCGIYGMKPTYGLVPYTGIMSIEVTMDHTGPMTNNVEDNALMLEVIAGVDGYDPRQYNVKTQRYTEALQGKDGLKGMKIAVVKEGYLQEGDLRAVDWGPLRRNLNAEKDVSEKVKVAVAALKSLGATVDEVSISMHLVGSAIAAPIAVEGTTQTMWGDGYGMSGPDLYVTSLMGFLRNWRNRANELPETMKLCLVFGTYIRKYYGSRYYGKAINLCRLLRAAYDKVLNGYDLLAMPTTIKAQPHPAPDASREEYMQRATEMHANTFPFNLTNHPAMAIPCGMSEGLPVSLISSGLIPRSLLRFFVWCIFALMSEYIHKSHNVSVLLYHLVCPAKYRRVVFTDEVDMTLKEICLEIAQRYEIAFIEIGTDRDHVHFLIQSVPSYRPTKIVKTVKSITAKEIFKRVPSIKKQLWGGEFWSKGYFISTVGRHAASEDAIRQYVKNQGSENEYQKLHHQQLELELC